jgi:flagellar hook-associated protein 1 FlgK
MSSSDLLSIGASGARAYRAAMGAVSENITNSTTEGYNRRVVLLGESASSSASSLFYKPGVSFGGVDVVAIVRKNDEYLDSAARIAQGNFENADARATWLGNVQTALDDGQLGVGQRLTTMFSAVERLASNPTDTTLRNNVLFSIDQVNTAFKQTSDDLKSVQAGIVTEAGNETLALNDALKRVASANEALRRAVPGSSNAAQLLDQRDLALTDVSKRLNVTISYGANGAADVSYDGKKLVDNIVPHTVEVTADANSKLSYSVEGVAVTVPQTGSLAGLSQSADVAAKRVGEVDALAAQYVTDLNSWHKAGYTTDGRTNVSIVSGTDAGSLKLLTDDPADLATMDAATGGALNGNLVKISTIRNTTGVENGWTAIISSHANLQNATNAEQAASQTRQQQALAAQSDVSGVDLDREAADLMRLQQAYEGCARVMQVAKETVQSIFAIF